MTFGRIFKIQMQNRVCVFQFSYINFSSFSPDTENNANLDAISLSSKRH